MFWHPINKNFFTHISHVSVLAFITHLFHGFLDQLLITTFIKITCSFNRLKILSLSAFFPKSLSLTSWSPGRVDSDYTPRYELIFLFGWSVATLSKVNTVQKVQCFNLKYFEVYFNIVLIFMVKVIEMQLGAKCTINKVQAECLNVWNHAEGLTA